MENIKEKPSFVEKETITNESQARELLEKESKKFKFKLICTGISVLSSIMWILGFSIDNIPEVIEYIMVGITGIGILATIICGPIEILKIIGKFIKFGFYAGVAFPLAIIMTVPMAAVLAVLMLIFAPAVYCSIALYNSYQRKNDAKIFLGLLDVSSVEI